MPTTLTGKKHYLPMYLLIGNRRESTPHHMDQTEFGMLRLQSADVHQQSSGWESCKKLKADGDNLHSVPSNKEREFSGDSSKVKELSVESGTEVLSGDAVTFSRTANVGSDNISSDVKDSLSTEVITFLLGASNIRDPALPLPAPSRFSRKK